MYDGADPQASEKWTSGLLFSQTKTHDVCPLLAMLHFFYRFRYRRATFDGPVGGQLAAHNPLAEVVTTRPRHNYTVWRHTHEAHRNSVLPLNKTITRSSRSVYNRGFSAHDRGPSRNLTPLINTRAVSPASRDLWWITQSLPATAHEPPA